MRYRYASRFLAVRFDADYELFLSFFHPYYRQDQMVMVRSSRGPTLSTAMSCPCPIPNHLVSLFIRSSPLPTDSSVSRFVPMFWTVVDDAES